MRQLGLLLLTLSAISFFGCGSSIPLSSLPISREATCIENISGKDYKYIAWGIGEDNYEAEQDALKCALWNALVGSAAGNCVALMNVSEREKNKGYFEPFFSSTGDWKTYVRSSNQGRIDPDKRLKLPSGEIKLGVEAIVAMKLLREDFEAKGLIGGMKIGY